MKADCSHGIEKVRIDGELEFFLEISLNLLDLFNDDIPKRFERKNKVKVKTVGIHPGWRDDSRTTSTLLHI